MEVRDAKGLTEAEFLAEYAKKDYPRPYVTADILVASPCSDGGAEVLLVRRKGHPYLGFWALPGGFANENEPLERTAARELAEETGLDGLALTPVGLYSAPGRDPRGWVVTQAYATLVNRDAVHPQAGDDAAETGWFRAVLEVPQTEEPGPARARAVVLDNEGRAVPLAFDHAEIIADGLMRLGVW